MPEKSYNKEVHLTVKYTLLNHRAWASVLVHRLKATRSYLISGSEPFLYD